MPTLVNSETAVANLALQRMGERPIVDINDQEEKPAIELKKVFALTRQGLLREHYFNFAVDVIGLQRLSAAPVNRFAFAYALPSDYVRAIGLNDDPPENADDFEIMSDSRLFTDATVAELRYVKDVEAVTRWDSLFIEAIVLRLAVRTCKTITGSDERVEQLQREYQGLALPNAKAASAREGKPELPWHLAGSRLVHSRRSSNLG